MKQNCSWLLGRVAVTTYPFWRGMKETGSFCPDLLEISSFKSGTLQYTETSTASGAQIPKYQARPKTNLCGEERFVLSGARRTDHLAQGPANLSCPHQHPKFTRNHLSGSDSDKAVTMDFWDCLVWKWPTLQQSNQKLESGTIRHPTPDNLASMAGHWDSEKTLPAI